MLRQFVLTLLSQKNNISRTDHVNNLSENLVKKIRGKRNSNVSLIPRNTLNLHSVSSECSDHIDCHVERISGSTLVRLLPVQFTLHLSLRYVGLTSITTLNNDLYNAQNDSNYDEEFNAKLDWFCTIVAHYLKPLNGACAPLHQTYPLTWHQLNLDIHVRSNMARKSCKTSEVITKQNSFL